MPRSRSYAALSAVIVAVLAAAELHAQVPSSLLHEFIPPDASEDVTLAATTQDGNLPAAIQTKSGLVTAPDPRKPPDAGRAYGGATTDGSPDSTYEPDRDTRRPNVESYDDPFSPATAPFKRLRAYDAVNPDYSLRVRDRALDPVVVGGAVAQGDEPFFGDYTVDLLPGQPVRVPTVGPDARLLKVHTVPQVSVAFLRDGADNWFVQGSVRERVRFVVELAAKRSTFGSELADVSWNRLDQAYRIDPPPHPQAFAEVARHVGISRAMRPREVVTRMVTYFRAFSPSDDPPRSREDIYLDLALTQKGVCRHRAFAFLVTALHIGVPARMVVNEAHAWVEVYDASIWHRIDLGGAAANLENQEDPARPPYEPPPDPYAWPAGRDSGDDLAERSRAEQAADPGHGGASSPSDPGAPAPSPITPPPPSPGASALASTPPPPAAAVSITAIDKDVRRGLPLHLRGSVASPSGPCSSARVDVVLVGREAPDGSVIGSLSTDDDGVFEGAVLIPRGFSLGDYDLVVVAPGNAQCSWGRSE